MRTALLAAFAFTLAGQTPELRMKKGVSFLKGR